jgi:hypothetical protein
MRVGFPEVHFEKYSGFWLQTTAHHEPMKHNVGAVQDAQCVSSLHDHPLPTACRLCEEDYRLWRRLVISLVLATDMAHHT